MGRGTYTTQSCVWGGYIHNIIMYGEEYIHMGRGIHTHVYWEGYMHIVYIHNKCGYIAHTSRSNS